MATKNIPNLFLHTPLFVGNPPPDTERPEPYGYPVKEGSFFRPADINSIWDLFVGWHDWAVQLNSELGMLYRIGQSCLQGRDPLTSKDCVDNLHLPSFNPFPERKLSFADTLLAGVPQFMLCVWELTLNGWRPMDPSDAVGRLLLHLRGRRSVQIGRTQYRSAVEAVFRSAFTLAGILEGYSELAAGLAITRRRHARQHTLDPWCWLRWLQEKQQAWIILYMLDQELSNFETSKIITQQKLRCERWRRAARERWMELLPSDPGFDWSVTYSDLINITNISRQIVNALDGYDEASLAEELSNEVEYVSQWLVAQTSPLPRDLGTDLVEIKQDAANGPSELGVAKDSKRADSSLEGGGVPAGAPKPRVDLRDPAEAPLVLGKAKQKLTAPQYDVVKALLDAGDAGLTKDQLVEKSHHEDARGILKRLANDPDWNKVFTLLVKQVAGIASNKKHNSSPFHTFSATIPHHIPSYDYTELAGDVRRW